MSSFSIIVMYAGVLYTNDEDLIRF